MQKHTVSLVGSGHTKFGRLDALTLEDLIVSAAREALDDAGVPAREVDAVFLGHFNSGMVGDGFASSLIHQASPDLRFTPATRCENACASGAAAIAAGVAAIQAGQASVVLVVGAEKMTHNSTADVTRALAGAGYQNDAQEAALSFPQVFAVAAQEYTRRYQDPLPAMAAIAAKNHGNAMRNPLAQMQRPLDFDACNTVSERNPLIAPPLRLTDCSLVTDGAAAIVLVSAERAKDFPREVALRGMAHVSDLLPMSSRDFLAFEGPRKAVGDAFERAGVQVADLDFAEVHDCFTIAELLIYEAMGLAPAGQGHRVLDDGTVMRGGKLPVNLSGGLKAKGHPVGATGVSMHAISFRQLTGRAGDLQIEQPTLGLVFNMGGAAVANYASVLEAKRA
ncbi:acetyl-CoA acetyltransferase [Bordetella petrii]|uniref:acetyl-CoA acetyltransferase n=1 Tax=Bordetella petrii TaxID=94624 RepID=UPI001E616DC7|nr:acetyl-CoA acetyltransferase [Bordetella petrii]MCD0504400.1 acetyl-CoA acetyltransferase [Bordetella petrii]